MLGSKTEYCIFSNFSRLKRGAYLRGVYLKIGRDKELLTLLFSILK